MEKKRGNSALSHFRYSLNSSVSGLLIRSRDNLRLRIAMKAWEQKKTAFTFRAHVLVNLTLKAYSETHILGRNAMSWPIKVWKRLLPTRIFSDILCTDVLIAKTGCIVSNNAIFKLGFSLNHALIITWYQPAFLYYKNNLTFFQAYQNWLNENELRSEGPLPGLEHLTDQQLFFLNFAQVKTNKTVMICVETSILCRVLLIII